MMFPVIRGLATAVPKRCYTQDEIYEILQPYFQGNTRAKSLFSNAGIGSRYLAVDGSYYTTERGTQERNERYLVEASYLGKQAIHRCLEKARVQAEAIDELIVVSCTGIDTPGLDLLLAGEMGMSPWLRRATILGMGCYGAFPGLLRGRDAAAARPGSRVMVLAVEICSLHFQPDDPSLENIVSAALFADGAAAALIQSGVDGEMDQPVGHQLVDSATYSDYQTLDHMAFHLTDHGFRMRLSSYVPRLLSSKVAEVVDHVLKRNHLRRKDIQHWAIHPGSSRILDYVRDQLDLQEDQLQPSRAVLDSYGNMSSATVLFVLEEIQRQNRPSAGEYGVLMSFGPGLTMECGLVRW